MHSNIRPTTILFRVNGHICISGFEHAVVLATRPNVPPSIEERQRGMLVSTREWCEAPEMLFGWEIGLEVDCWAFGTVLIWMITGKVRDALRVVRPLRADIYACYSIRGMTAPGRSLI